MASVIIWFGNESIPDRIDLTLIKIFRMYWFERGNGESTACGGKKLEKREAETRGGTLKCGTEVSLVEIQVGRVLAPKNKHE